MGRRFAVLSLLRLVTNIYLSKFYDVRLFEVRLKILCLVMWQHWNGESVCVEVVRKAVDSGADRTDGVFGSRKNAVSKWNANDEAVDYVLCICQYIMHFELIGYNDAIEQLATDSSADVGSN